MVNNQRFQVWSAVCSTVRQVVEEAESVSKDQIVGIGFDATCSLVLVGQVSRLRMTMIFTLVISFDRIGSGQVPMPIFMIVDRIGFGQGGSQLPVDEEGNEDIIMWMDHRQSTAIVNIIVISCR